MVCKLKTERQLLLRLSQEGYSQQLEEPSMEHADTLQFLYRHLLVKMRRQVTNELQHLALNQFRDAAIQIVAIAANPGAAHAPRLLLGRCLKVGSQRFTERLYCR
jgi:hypothetical protein